MHRIRIFTAFNSHATQSCAPLCKALFLPAWLIGGIRPRKTPEVGQVPDELVRAAEFCSEVVKSKLLHRQVPPSLLQQNAAIVLQELRPPKKVPIREGSACRESALLSLLHAAVATYCHQQTAMPSDSPARCRPALWGRQRICKHCKSWTQKGCLHMNLESLARRAAR